MIPATLYDRKSQGKEEGSFCNLLAVNKALPHDLLLKGASSNQAVHVDHLLLPNAMSSVHRLLTETHRQNSAD